MSPFSTKSILYFTFLFLFNKSNAYGFHLGVPAATTGSTTVQAVAPAVQATATGIIPTVVSATGAASATMVSAAMTPSTVVKAAEALCTRTQCYEKLASTVGNNIERVIMTETSNQVSYLNSVVTNKLSSAMGPAIAVAMKAGPISSKINNGEYIGASGVATEAVGMYYVGAQSFLFCSANSAFLGPYAIIPGFVCAGIATAVVENTLYDIKTNLFVPTPKTSPNYHHRYNNEDDN
jgi:hypothetical protein